MYPDDRVIVGVINRKRDLVAARDEHWYRIPRDRMPRGVHAEYLAFFTSGKAFREKSGGISFYAPLTGGVELAYRRDLLPNEAEHARANEVYYRVGLLDLLPKTPPVRNVTGRAISFVMTTWDRFVHAETIADLYSKNDYFVDRIYHALRDSGLEPLRYWDAERKGTGHGAQVRILCEGGDVVASPESGEGSLFLREGEPDDKILAQILAAIVQAGGPVTVNVPLEGL